MQAYGRELKEAADWCRKYQGSRKDSDLHQAWDLYYHVFKQINKQLPSLTVLELQYVAPALVRAQASLHGPEHVLSSQCDAAWHASARHATASLNYQARGVIKMAGVRATLNVRAVFEPRRSCMVQGLELAVPGTYLIGEPVVTIAAFAPQLTVITSKQRPRRLTIHGSDGAEYMFLLKGHEDLRQVRWIVMDAIAVLIMVKRHHCLCRVLPDLDL